MGPDELFKIIGMLYVENVRSQQSLESLQSTLKKKDKDLRDKEGAVSLLSTKVKELSDISGKSESDP